MLRTRQLSNLFAQVLEADTAAELSGKLSRARVNMLNDIKEKNEA